MSQLLAVWGRLPQHGISATAPNGVPRLYAGRVVKGIVVQLAVMLLFIELIFLTEKFYYILRTAIDHHVKAADVLLLLIYTAPQISDLALPLALMIAVYRVALRCREDRELLVFAGIGVGIHQFLWLAMVVGVGAQIVSLLVSGVIDPRAQFSHRSVLFDAQHDALRGGVTPGQFYFFGRYTVFAGPQEQAKPERGLFIHRDDGETQRVIVAARVRLTDPDEEGRMTLRLQDVVAQDFRLTQGDETGAGAGPTPCDDCRSSYLAEPTGSMRIGKFSQELNLDTLIRFDPRGRSVGEWSSMQLVGLTTPPGPIGKTQVSEAGRRVGRSLLCLIAPLIACLALALTTRVTQAFALPAACIAVMGFDLTWSRFSDILAPYGLWAVLLVLGLSVLAASVPLAVLVVRMQNAIVKPALARA